METAACAEAGDVASGEIIAPADATATTRATTSFRIDVPALAPPTPHTETRTRFRHACSALSQAFICGSDSRRLHKENGRRWKAAPVAFACARCVSALSFP